MSYYDHAVLMELSLGRWQQTPRRGAGRGTKGDTRLTLRRQYLLLD